MWTSSARIDTSDKGAGIRILIANDDGIYSPGIAALARIAASFGAVRVVAPDVERSSASHAITGTRPLRIRRTNIFDGIDAWRVDGTPADCVALGMHDWHADVVLSGINLGPNLGNAIWHSGTLAAAHQAVLQGSRGIALSTLASDAEPDFAALAPHVRRVLELLLPRTDLRFVNVNLPPSPRGIAWTKQAVKAYDGRVVPGTDPMGRAHFWLTVVPIEDVEPGTDLFAMEQRYISITPLALDLTDEPALARAAREAPLDRVEGAPARPKLEPETVAEANAG